MSWCSDTRYPKAKKEHKCQYCYKLIQVGERYAAWFATDGADTWYSKAHVACANVMDDHCRKCECRDIDCWSDECFDYAAVDEVCKKHCEKYRSGKCEESHYYQCELFWKVLKDNFGDIRK